MLDEVGWSCGDCCSDDPNALKNSIYLASPLSIDIPISRAKALKHKSGDHVQLCGRPFFIQSSGFFMVDGMKLEKSFASILMSPGVTPIGSLQLSVPRYDIYDPKRETLQ